MQSKIKIILGLLSTVLCIAMGSLLLSGIRVIADIFAYIDPTYTPIVFWTLTALGAALCSYAALTLFVFPKPLFMPKNPTAEQLEEYRHRYIQRLRCNPFIKSQQLACETQQEIDDCIAILKAKANKQIEETSKRVFIGTATAQNGRLDTLIVFALITHLIYKITKLYAQRPHLRDLLTLYKNVAATAFFAGALEDIVVEEYTQQIVAPLVATSVVGSVPGAQSIASVVTTSILDGSINSLLSMRCGIIARNYMSIYTDGDLVSPKELRKAATSEAAAMVMQTSGDTISTVAQVLISGASKTVKCSMTKAWDAVRNIAPSSKKHVTPENAQEPSKNSKEKKERFSATRSCVSGAADTIVTGASTTGTTIKYATKKTASGVASSFSAATSTASKGLSAAASSASKNASNAAHTVSKGISDVASAATSAKNNINATVSSATTRINVRATTATSGLHTAATSTAHSLHSISKKTASAVNKADAKVKNGVIKSGKKVSAVAGNAKKTLTHPFSKKKQKNKSTQRPE